jgi:aminocarboxymuconate-semialdehyde decarboxylase
MIVDSHAHFVPPSLIADLAEGRARFPSVAVEPAQGSIRLAFAGGGFTRPINPGLSGIDRRLAWMRENGIDRQVNGGWLDMFGYELPADEGADWARLINEHLMAAGRKTPEIVPLATVPLQSGRRAEAVLAEALDAGFAGVMIGTQPRGIGGGLDDADLEPFWDTASRREAVVMVHPTYDPRDERLLDYDMINAVGRTCDLTIAAARMLYAGLPQRYPGARIVLVTGGGALPFALGRLARNHVLKPQDYADPEEGLARLYFDTLVFRPDALAFLIELVGCEKLMLGSDQPFPIGDQKPMAVIDALKLSDGERKQLLSANAVSLFRLLV